jgi:TatA/E family protein of Tat protein translocase
MALEGGRMFGFGLGELLAVLLIIVVLFNRRLPDLGQSFGSAIRKFRKAVNASDEIDITPPTDQPGPGEKKD